MFVHMLSALPLIALNLFVHFFFCSAGVHGRQSCGAGYNVCSPPGTSAHEAGFLEAHLANLYMNLLTTVNPQDGARPQIFNAAEPKISSPLQLNDLPQALCCRSTT